MPKQEEWRALKEQALVELGLAEKVERDGWGSLTAAESGRIGGWMLRLKAERSAAQKTAP